MEKFGCSPVDVRLFDSLASVRVVQTVRNDGTAPLDLAPRLPTSDARVERLRVAQGDRAIELLSRDDVRCDRIRSARRACTDDAR